MVVFGGVGKREVLPQRGAGCILLWACNRSFRGKAEASRIFAGGAVMEAAKVGNLPTEEAPRMLFQCPGSLRCAPHRRRGQAVPGIWMSPIDAAGRAFMPRFSVVSICASPPFFRRVSLPRDKKPGKQGK